MYARDYFIPEASFSLSHIGIAYSKNFCCPRKLESIVRGIVAADLYAKNLRDRRYMAQLRLPEIKNLAYDRTGISPLTLEDLTGAFLVFSIGNMLAFLVLVVEIFVNKNNIRKVSKKQIIFHKLWYFCMNI